jgi:hypothetical protein
MRAINSRNWIFVTDCLRTRNAIELRTDTVAIKYKVVRAVLHLLAAETLYKNLCVPIKNNAMIAKVYQLAIIGFLDWGHVKWTAYRCYINLLAERIKVGFWSKQRSGRSVSGG